MRRLFAPLCVLAGAFAGLASCRGCARAPGGAAAPFTALACIEGRCTDPDDRTYHCDFGGHATGRGVGLGRACGEVGCSGPDCKRDPVLSGEVVRGDDPDHPRMPGEEVAVWRAADPSAEHVFHADADGHYALFAPPGEVLFVAARKPGFITELHAVRVPAAGWDVPLDLRLPGAFAGLPAEPRQDPSKGMMVLEFLGSAPAEGVGAKLTPEGNEPVAFLQDGKVAPRRTLGGGTRELLLFLNLPPGEARVEYLSPPGVRCASQAGLDAWPVRPGTLTQVDVECARTP